MTRCVPIPWKCSNPPHAAMTDVPFLVPWNFSRQSINRSSLAPSSTSLAKCKAVPTRESNIHFRTRHKPCTHSLRFSLHVIVSPIKGALLEETCMEDLSRFKYPDSGKFDRGVNHFCEPSHSALHLGSRLEKGIAISSQKTDLSRGSPSPFETSLPFTNASRCDSPSAEASQTFLPPLVFPDASSTLIKRCPLTADIQLRSICSGGVQSVPIKVHTSVVTVLGF